MSKADGQYIGIKFTEEITSDPASIISYAYSQITNAVVTTLNQYSTTYGTSALVDGIASTSNYWRGTTATNWIQVRYYAAKIVAGFRWYIPNATYYPKTFTASGSNDGSTWTQLGGTLAGTGTTGWQEFTFTNTTAYLYYRIDILTCNSTRPHISELQLYVAQGNETAFTVSGQEYDMEPGGTLASVTYTAASVAAHPTEGNAILLTLEPFDRFHKVNGNITVAYDSTLGALAGAGGPVASFSQTFTPTDLVNKPNPHDMENIEISSLSATGTLTAIIYHSAYNGGENIEITGITATGTLTHVDDL